VLYLVESPDEGWRFAGWRPLVHLSFTIAGKKYLSFWISCLTKSK
jgi:hypothetical protein